MKPLTVANGLLAMPGYRTPQPVDQIRWLEGVRNYTRIHLSQKKTPLLVCQTLKDFEKPLSAFLRATRGALINPAYVRAVTWVNAMNMTLTLSDDVLIRVSRRRIAAVATKLAIMEPLLISAVSPYYNPSYSLTKAVRLPENIVIPAVIHQPPSKAGLLVDAPGPWLP
ncbi:LytR/AlgR family response regulator transcription factor [Spirosoma pulveris]